MSCSLNMQGTVVQSEQGPVYIFKCISNHFSTSTSMRYMGTLSEQDKIMILKALLVGQIHWAFGGVSIVFAPESRQTPWDPDAG